MISKAFFKYIALAAIASGTMGLVIVAIHLAKQLIDVVTSYADGIIRLML